MLTITLLILSVVAGGVAGRLFGSRNGLANHLLILSAGFLITVCVNEVFPEVYVSHKPNIGILVIGGVLLQMVLEGLTKGFEHGHDHSLKEDRAILPAALILGLFVHAFLEGIPLAGQDKLTPYLAGILFHNLPISFVLGPFLFKKSERISVMKLLTFSLFALASPLGMLAGRYIPGDLHIYFLAVVGGIFLHISSVIIFESDKHHHINIRKLGLVVAGAALALSEQLFT